MNELSPSFSATVDHRSAALVVGVKLYLDKSVGSCQAFAEGAGWNRTRASPSLPRPAFAEDTDSTRATAALLPIVRVSPRSVTLIAARVSLHEPAYALRHYVKDAAFIAYQRTQVERAPRSLSFGAAYLPRIPCFTTRRERSVGYPP